MGHKIWLNLKGLQPIFCQREYLVVAGTFLHLSKKKVIIFLKTETLSWIWNTAQRVFSQFYKKNITHFLIEKKNI